MTSKFFKINKRLRYVLIFSLALIASLIVIFSVNGLTAYAAGDSQVDFAGSKDWQEGEGNLGFRQLMTQTKDSLGNDVENTFDVEVDVFI